MIKLEFEYSCGFFSFFNEGEPFGSYEVFEESSNFYWRAGFPGYLPDGEAVGPFKTIGAAHKDANVF